MNLDLPLFTPPPPSGEEFTLFLFKFFFLLSAGLYVLFAFVVVRQIKVMKSTLITPSSPLLTIAGYIHLAISVFVLLLFWVLL